MSSSTTEGDGELLRGAAAIGAFLGIPPNAVYHLVKTNRIPHFHLGTSVYASKTSLRNWVLQIEANTSVEIPNLVRK